MEEKSFEIRFGVTLAIFAAVLSINELFSGHYGDDELQLSNEKSSAYLWYQAKGIKESLSEGQKDLVDALLKGGAIKAEATASMEQLSKDLQAAAHRYKKEKKEIMVGSKSLDPKDWAQDVDGKLGQVVGAKEIETQLEKLGAAGDRFDLATLALQLCLVMGAIGLTMGDKKLKNFLYGTMVVLGIVGSLVMGTALHLVL
jgi:hypothetical protein